MIATLSAGSESDQLRFHRNLAAYNRRRLTPTLDAVGWERTATQDLAWLLEEGRFIEDERQTVDDRAREAPSDPEAFVAWYEHLAVDGPGQGDPLFDWLATDATVEEMVWFLSQEVAGEAGFEDLVALTQIKLPRQAKLELARNFWDEMGQGHAGGMHGPMLEHLVEELGIVPSTPIVWESLALGNLMTALAANRRLAYQSIGALGVIELTSPGRARLVNMGLKRLGVGGEARRYFALHATLDVKHSGAWNREALFPLVAEDPHRAKAIAEGALMRLEAGRRCFDRYRSELNPSRSLDQIA